MTNDYKDGSDHQVVSVVKPRKVWLVVLQSAAQQSKF